MTARSHETIRVGLRRVIRDPNVKVKDRLEAIKLLMHVEGLMDAEETKDKRGSASSIEANNRELLELLKVPSRPVSPENWKNEF
jgi:flagellar biosynthesis component FlhA